ncbi:MAG: hypothetical protein ACRD21_03920, partial [Vicinamibacteria bacterium]
EWSWPESPPFDPSSTNRLSVLRNPSGTGHWFATVHGGAGQFSFVDASVRRLYNGTGGVQPEIIRVYSCPGGDDYLPHEPASFLPAGPQSAVCNPIVAYTHTSGASGAVDFVDLAAATPLSTTTVTETTFPLSPLMAVVTPEPIPVDVSSASVPDPPATPPDDVELGADTQRIFTTDALESLTEPDADGNLYGLTAAGDLLRFTPAPNLSPVPLVTLKVNGQHPDPPIVTTAGAFELTLDVSPTSYTGSLDWYWALVVNGQLFWVTAGGLSTTAAPLFSSPPFPLTNATLLNLTLPPGVAVTSAVFLVDGATLVASDFITAVVDAS